MFKYRVCSLLFLVIIMRVSADLGVDVFQLYSENTYKCLNNAGYNFAILRALRSYGGMDTKIVQNLINAQNAGFNTDIYAFPCRGKSLDSQVTPILKYIPSYLYETIWIDVQANPSSGCSWSAFSNQSNCQFIVKLIDQFQKNGRKCGIYTNRYMWTSILGGRYSCKQAAKVDLWYAHYDGQADIQDFENFGGWTQPKMKQFKENSKECGANIDRNYL